MLEIQYIKKEDQKWAVKVFGEGPIEIVIEMGLGALMGEWYPIAERLGKHHTVLLYERLGVGLSSIPKMERTPQQIARELDMLLNELTCKEQLVLIGHSQGGLYIQQFARLFPSRVKGIILLDPLSPADNTFKEVLTEKEYQKSGVDKSNNFKLMKRMVKCHLGFLIRSMMKSAPPFYYYKDFTKDEADNILQGLSKWQFSETALMEYTLAHNKQHIEALMTKGNFPDVPLVLITHDSEKAIEENMLFGHNTRDFAEKIEELWQKLMKDYLQLSEKSSYICATDSTHYIHLQQPELIEEALRRIL